MISESGTVEKNRPGAVKSGPQAQGGLTEDANTVVKRMMRKRRSTATTTKPEDVDHLKAKENAAYTMCLQQDKDIEYREIDFQSIVIWCGELGFAT
ncbi:putative phosphoglucan phosphatase LSF2, chloroplastic [Cocos nucifera]|uniref:Putative phosphoglucan phosphatase LSF2, chloroplastic n=1 Tax=Cocos nucifera TaxID=13894 RepID=A0A8K0I514_COCNU|nr:putative phosphoglucan phosphatase LSF2, chloroplastic [Cocos nucifera]